VVVTKKVVKKLVLDSKKTSPKEHSRWSEIAELSTISSDIRFCLVIYWRVTL